MGAKTVPKIHATKSLTSLFQIYQNESCQQIVYLEDFLSLLFYSLITWNVCLNTVLSYQWVDSLQYASSFQRKNRTCESCLILPWYNLLPESSLTGPCTNIISTYDLNDGYYNRVKFKWDWVKFNSATRTILTVQANFESVQLDSNPTRLHSVFYSGNQNFLSFIKLKRSKKMSAVVIVWLSYKTVTSVAKCPWNYLFRILYPYLCFCQQFTEWAWL